MIVLVDRRECAGSGRGRIGNWTRRVGIRDARSISLAIIRVIDRLAVVVRRARQAVQRIVDVGIGFGHGLAADGLDLNGRSHIVVVVIRISHRLHLVGQVGQSRAGIVRVFRGDQAVEVVISHGGLLAHRVDDQVLVAVIVVAVLGVQGSCLVTAGLGLIEIAALRVEAPHGGSGELACDQVLVHIGHSVERVELVGDEVAVSVLLGDQVAVAVVEVSRGAAGSAGRGHREQLVQLVVGVEGHVGRSVGLGHRQDVAVAVVGVRRGIAVAIGLGDLAVEGIVGVIRVELEFAGRRRRWKPRGRSPRWAADCWDPPGRVGSVFRGAGCP